MLIIPVSVLPASGDYNDPASASGVNWTGPTNVFSDDGSWAIYNKNKQRDLFATNFSIGATSARIDSIIVRINGHATGGVQDDRKIDVALTKNGTSEVGDVVTVLLNQDIDADAILRGSTDDLWGTSWTVAEINATTFGVTINKFNTTTNTIRIDHVQVKVWWTPLSVLLSNSTFAFGTNPLNTWLTPQTSVITNDGTVAENFVGQISQFTEGSNTWEIDVVGNGADIIRAQWSTTSAAGPWTDISAYDTDFTIATNVAVDDSVSFWFHIETPTSTSSYNEYSTTLTVTAE